MYESIYGTRSTDRYEYIAHIIHCSFPGRKGAACCVFRSRFVVFLRTYQGTFQYLLVVFYSAIIVGHALPLLNVVQHACMWPWQLTNHQIMHEEEEDGGGAIKLTAQTSSNIPDVLAYDIYIYMYMSNNNRILRMIYQVPGNKISTFMYYVRVHVYS